jgi:hypothetical protein
MSRPLTPSEECALTFPPRSFEYMECLKTKISNPYTLGYELPLPMNVGAIILIIAIIILIVYLSVKANLNPLDFFR